jgi:large subunit ribosomal protein L28
MSNTCQVCGKGKVVGGSIVRKGLAKKQGGIGMHVVKNNKRTFKPNIQSVRVRSGEGVKRMKVCTSCIRSGKIQKA